VRRQNGSAEIAVSDSGPGLDEEHLAHVFERFYRADSSRARASGGVGLGLAIVAAVAEAHGGSVSARSTPGEGATFEIALPLAGQGNSGEITGISDLGGSASALPPSFY
jgi:two-component system OmpR family sensor kinase